MNRDESEVDLVYSERRDLARARCVRTHALAPGSVAGCCVCQLWADSLTALTPADLAARDRVVAATAAETALRDAAEEIAATHPHGSFGYEQWLQARADALAAAAHPDEESKP